MIRPLLFRDINFSAGLAMMFAVGTILVSSISLMAPWLQTMANYPVATAGLVMAPRGLGNVLTILFTGRYTNRIDARLMVAVGLLLECWSFWEMTTWTPDVSVQVIVTTIFVQGAGLGLVFTPLQVLAFATLDPMLRTEGASLFSLGRNIGAAIGVSVTSSLLTHNTQILHEQIGAVVTPFNRALQTGGAVQQFLDPDTPHGAMLLDRIINTQAQVTAYTNDYVLMVGTTLPALLLLLLMRQPRHPVAAEPQPAD
jgi:DHA2 family multidrug resistance protein